MIDVQFESQHLLSLGATNISRDKFLSHINKLVNKAPIDWELFLYENSKYT